MQSIKINLILTTNGLNLLPVMCRFFYLPQLFYIHCHILTDVFTLKICCTSVCTVLLIPSLLSTAASYILPKYQNSLYEQFLNLVEKVWKKDQYPSKVISFQVCLVRMLLDWTLSKVIGSSANQMFLATIFSKNRWT